VESERCCEAKRAHSTREYSQEPGTFQRSHKPKVAGANPALLREQAPLRRVFSLPIPARAFRRARGCQTPSFLARATPSHQACVGPCAKRRPATSRRCTQVSAASRRCVQQVEETGSDSPSIAASHAAVSRRPMSSGAPPQRRTLAHRDVLRRYEPPTGASVSVDGSPPRKAERRMLRRAESYGCISLATASIDWLAARIGSGTPVKIH
jgi:hypothetical protein